MVGHQSAGDSQTRQDKFGLLPFEVSVFQERLALVQSDLHSSGIAGVLLFDPENIFWLTGYQTIGYFTFQTLLVTPTGPPTVVSRVVNHDIAMAYPTIGAFESVVDTASHVEVLCAFLQRSVPPGAVIGFESRATYLSVKDYLALQQSLDRTLVEWGGVIEPHRLIKSDAEISRMLHAARCAEAGLRAAIDAIAPGKTENDIAAAMFEASIASGSEYLGHPPLVVAGETTSLCFAMWRRREIRRGDIVLLEAAGCVDRYHAILARPVVVGTPSKRHRDAAATLKSVLETAIETIKPGLTAGEVDRACRHVVAAQGFGQYYKSRSAYGIGIGFPPNWSEGHIYAIRPDDPLVLEPNMTFHVIPSLFLDDFGMCFSDSVRVTETGCEVLTEFPRRLFEVDG